MITAVVLAHNDEKIIEDAIQSVSWCDEILVLDDYSSDKTVEVVKKVRCRVIERHLNDDFAAHRNFALAQAKGEWVLFIDSDERISADLQKEISEVIKQNKHVGYYVRRIDYLFGRAMLHGETGNMRLLRLAKKDVGLWTRPVHEVWNVDGSVGFLSAPLLHYPHPNVAQFLDKVSRYSTLNAAYLYSQRVKPSLWKIIVYPKAKFFVNYVWSLGFLDGTAGAIVALMMSFHSFLTRAKLYLLWEKNTKSV